MKHAFAYVLIQDQDWNMRIVSRFKLVIYNLFYYLSVDFINFFCVQNSQWLLTFKENYYKLPEISWKEK